MVIPYLLCTYRTSVEVPLALHVVLTKLYIRDLKQIDALWTGKYVKTQMSIYV
jgi:hypothetical protein